MTRRARCARGAPLALALLALAGHPGCSAIGGPAGVPDGLPHGGTGQFRFLDDTETMITGPLPGRAMVLRNRAVGAAMPAGGSLFYAQADLLDMAPMLPEDHPVNEVFRDAFGPYSILRASARTEGTGTFENAVEVLAASEAWEGAEVRDPWAVVLEDGSARLYYAADGGIGVATAPSVEGPFTKHPGPILDASVGGAEVPSRPSVVGGIDGGWLMYVDVGDGIRVASSDDGLSWTPAGPIGLEGEDEGESPEARVGSPGAVRVVTTAHRALIRVYFTSFREDGAFRAYVAGSEDGVSFVRHPREVMDNADVRYPAPLTIDTRVTLLYLNLPFFGGTYQTRGISVAVAPAGERFDDVTE